MLTDFLFAIGTLALKILNFLIPNWKMPDEFVNAFTYFANIIMPFDGIFPLNELILTILIIIQFELIVLMIKLVSGILNYIRGSGSIDI